ncbi:MAG: hypothetical protein EPN88_12240 [Bacteroidetes bacterium]|nr:MAG: hypothetical protein EPN88_12240 [Bacteroidota bacterium]
MKTIKRLLILTTILVMVLFSNCKKTNDLAPFSPEITNLPDNFQLQATNIVNVSTSITYSWTNSGTKANIDISGILTSGDGSLSIKDSNNAQVYTSDLKTTGSTTSIAGVTGSWKITLVLTNSNGTLNFRVQKGN